MPIAQRQIVALGTHRIEKCSRKKKRYICPCA